MGIHLAPQEGVDVREWMPSDHPFSAAARLTSDEEFNTFFADIDAISSIHPQTDSVELPLV